MTPNAPYHFTPEETETFLRFHKDDGRVQDYLRTKKPSYGIIVKEPITGNIVNDLLLFVDASNKTHVIYVSGLPIVEQINKAPYVSKDDTGFWTQFEKDFKAALGTATKTIAMVGIGLLALMILTRGHNS